MEEPIELTHKNRLRLIAVGRAFEVMKNEMGDRSTANFVRALVAIAMNPSITAADLTEHLRLSRSTVNKILLRLQGRPMRDGSVEGLGMIYYEGNKYDRRLAEYYVNEKGMKFLLDFMEELPSSTRSRQNKE